MILTIGPGGCGFTFLNWSIAYLRGDEYYYTLFNDKVQVDINPLKGSTAHNFKKDHLNPDVDRSTLSTASNNSIVYVVPKDDNDFKLLIEIPGKKIIFDNSKFCSEQLARHYTTVPTSPFIHITDQLSKKYNIKQIKKVLLDLSNNFFLNYYKLPDNTDNFIINYQDMFNNLDSKILEIFKFLNISVSTDRWQTWNNIYQDYKLLNKDILSNFVKDIINIDSSSNTKILKEIINWKIGSYQKIWVV
jgi:hypothetical protein